MKHLFLMIFLQFSLMAVTAQEIRVSFTARKEGEVYCPFTAVIATNVTRGWTETLLYPDTVMVLTTMDGIGEYQQISKSLYLGEPYPNPFSDETHVMLELIESDEVSFQVFGIDGRVVADYKTHLDAGRHRLTVRLSNPMMAFLAVTTTRERQVVRVLNTGKGEQNLISIESLSTDYLPSQEMYRGEVTGEFEPGDIMRYEARRVQGGAIAYSDTITQALYSDQVVTLHFSTTAPIGAINGLFSVGPDKQVYFSRGNLQYQASTNTWRFAEHQYDFVGNATYGNVYVNGVKCDNTLASENYNGWIDLYAWGTSGWDCGNTYYNPWEHGESCLIGPPGQYSLTTYPQSDWGIHNPIINGGNMAGLWRTLTNEEWNYVFTTRVTNSGIIFAKAHVAGESGLILLPDDWSASYYPLHDINTGNYNSNAISAEDWYNIFEINGAVFLPAAGYRIGISIINGVGSDGDYWSASCAGYNQNGCFAYYLEVLYNRIFLDNRRARNYGCSVRLVSTVE